MSLLIQLDCGLLAHTHDTHIQTVLLSVQFAMSIIGLLLNVFGDALMSV